MVGHFKLRNGSNRNQSDDEIKETNKLEKNGNNNSKIKWNNDDK